MSELPSRSAQSQEDLESVLLALLLILRLTVSAEIRPWAGFLNNALLALLVLLFLAGNPRRLWAGPAMIRAGIVLTLAAGLISTAFALNHHLSVRQLLMDLGGILAALAVAGRGPRGLRAVATALTAGAGIGVLFALRQHFGGFERTLTQVEAGSYAFVTLQRGRVFGLTFSPDMLAAIMAGAIPVALGLTVATRAGQKARPWWLVPAGAALLMAGVLVLTLSLGGWIAAGGGILLWALLQFSRLPARLGKTRFMIIGALLLLFAAGAVLVIAARGGSHLDLNDPNNPVKLRLDNWRSGMEISREFPLTGAGPGGYQLAVYLHRGPWTNEARHAHNLLVETLSETGPLGLLGLSLLLAGLALGVLRSAGSDETDPSPRALRAGLLAGAAAVAAHGLIDFSFETVETALFFWVGVGVLMQGGQAGDDAEALTRSGKVAAGLVASALILIAVLELFAVKRARAEEAAQQAAEAGEWSRARDLAREALRRDVHNDELMLILAHAVAATSTDQARGRDQAVSLLESAIAANPRYPFHWRDLGLLLTPTDPDRAEQCLRRAAALYPVSQSLNLELGRFLHRVGKIEQAKAVLTPTLELGINKGHIYLELARIAREQGRGEQEEIYLREASRYPPYDGWAALAWADFLIKHQRIDDALRFLRNWTAKYPGREPVEARLQALERAVPSPVSP